MSESVEKRELIPKLRFPEFLEASAWTMRSLAEEGEVIRGLTYTAADVNENGLPVLRSSNIQRDRLLLDEDIVHVRTVSAPDMVLRRNDLVICMSNGSKALVGKNAVYRPTDDKERTVGAFCAIYRSHNTYARLLLSSSMYQSHVRDSIAGGNINNLTPNQLGSFVFPFPSGTSEQQKIAECLESLDELISAETGKLEALKRHKKGLLQQLFPAEGETTPRLRFPEFSTAGEWFEGSIGELGDVVTGTTPSTAKREFYGKDVLFASPADISGHRIVSETANGLSTLGAKQARLVAPGSSLFVCIGSTIGKVAQNAEACATNQQINAVVSDSERFDPDFVYYLLLTKANIVRELAGKQAVPLVSKTVFCSVRVDFPLIDEQRTVASLLNELDRVQSAEHHFLEMLRNHKAALMQQLFPNVDEVEA